MICNPRIMLVGILCLPTWLSASPDLSESSWQFAGTRYRVLSSNEKVSVIAQREFGLAIDQMKSLCRKGLGLPLRQWYEAQLLAKGLITETLSDWPMANLRYRISDIHYQQVSTQMAGCSATVADTGEGVNLHLTALNYAFVYFQSHQSESLYRLLPYLMEQPDVSMDAASLVALALSKHDQPKAVHYFEKYVDVSAMKDDRIQLELASWLFRNENYDVALEITEQCQSTHCRELSLDIEERLLEKEQASAADLSSYF